MLNAMRLFGGRLFIDAELLHKEVIDCLVAALERTSALLASVSTIGEYGSAVRYPCSARIPTARCTLGFETPSERATSTL